jgi:hypothetical protein
MDEPSFWIQIERNNEDGPTDDRELRKLRKLFWSKTGKGAGRPRKLKVVGVINFCSYQAVIIHSGDNYQKSQKRTEVSEIL